MSIIRLYLAGNHIPTGAVLGHLQIVAETDSGIFRETEVQIDPTYNFVGNWQFKVDELHTIPTQGPIGLPGTTEFTVTQEFNSSTYYDCVQLNLGGRTAENVWNVINDTADSISNFSLPYDILYNSNTFAVTLLNIVGISTSLPSPGLVLGYPGAGRLVTTGRLGSNQVTYDIDGTSGNDIINGQGYNDTFRMLGIGDDSVRGGEGNDTFIFEGSDSLTIRDSDPGDILKWGTKTLTGNERPECDDETPMEGRHGETYSVGGNGTLTITLPDGGNIRIQDWRNGGPTMH